MEETDWTKLCCNEGMAEPNCNVYFTTWILVQRSSHFHCQNTALIINVWIFFISTARIINIGMIYLCFIVISPLTTGATYHFISIRINLYTPPGEVFIGIVTISGTGLQGLVFISGIVTVSGTGSCRDLYLYHS